MFKKNDAGSYDRLYEILFSEDEGSREDSDEVSRVDWSNRYGLVFDLETNKIVFNTRYETFDSEYVGRSPTTKSTSYHLNDDLAKGIINEALNKGLIRVASSD